MPGNINIQYFFPKLLLIRYNSRVNKILNDIQANLNFLFIPENRLFDPFKKDAYDPEAFNLFNLNPYFLLGRHENALLRNLLKKFHLEKILVVLSKKRGSKSFRIRLNFIFDPMIYTFSLCFVYKKKYKRRN